MGSFRTDAQPAEEQPVVRSRVESGQDAGGSDRCGVCLHGHPHRSIAVLRMQSSVEIQNDLPVIIGTSLQAFPVIADPPGELRGEQLFQEHLRTQAVDHLRENDPCFLIGIGPGQDLSARQAVPAGAVFFDILHRHGIHAPGVGAQDLAVDSESFIEKFLVIL